jgi:hypothetical protein
MGMTFRYYLERRQAGDDEVKAFLEGCDPAVLDSAAWAEVMGHLTKAAADRDYIMWARQLWQDYARTSGAIFRRPH